MHLNSILVSFWTNYKRTRKIPPVGNHAQSESLIGKVKHFLMGLDKGSINIQG